MSVMTEVHHKQNPTKLHFIIYELIVPLQMPKIL